MSHTTHIHGVTAATVKVQRVRDNDCCQDHDVYTLTLSHEDGQLPTTVHLFCKPEALDESDLAK